MNQYTMNILEFNKVIEEIKKYTLTEKARQKIAVLQPCNDIDIINIWMTETTEAAAMLSINSSVPLISMEGIEAGIVKAEKEMVLTPQEISSFQNLLEGVKRVRKYMDSMQSIGPRITAYAWSMYELKELVEEIRRCIVNGQVDDRATTELARIRKRILIVEDRIKQKLNEILRSPVYKGMLQDSIVSSRSGRYVVPVRRQDMKKFPGQVLDMSSTGSTVFMEPAVITKLHAELNLLQMEESNEVYRILADLSGQVAEYRQELSINMEAMVHYDFVFAKAKYSCSMDMKAVSLNRSNEIKICHGRHPLLGQMAVPLDFSIGQDYRALIITGPNTGGKTVALKTVGLLTLMVQSGLHVPVAEGSQFAVFSDILADIGDGQSIEQSLSTFSSHVKNIQMIIKTCSSSTLVIMDELGAGTDPGEGRGFAIAVLEEIFNRGTTIVATTHFGEIKEYALNTSGFENGCMAFDIRSLRPLYQLHIGNWGDSNAFLIALRLGMGRHIIERAHEITYGERISYEDDYDQYVDSIVDQKEIQTQLEGKRRMEESHKEKEKRERSEGYVKKDLKLGDRVYISTMQRTGIICEEQNGRGDLVVLVMGKKYVINNKRLTLHIDRKDLYPENYDLDIIFETKENRKKRKIMSKRHVEGMVIEQDNESKD
ncbi:MAG: DNA mismatch repair protein [Firmicutes bacterium HGW-Firmicutes-15]|nr:MAG: DNA mismatch repair protein [Firmicutes bacterium HGW-Firmicutes-15]